MIRRSILLSAAALTTVLLAAGCSGSDTPGVTASAASAGSGSATTTSPASETTTPTTSVTDTSAPDGSVAPVTTKPNAVVSTLNQPGEGAYEGALQDVVAEPCTAVDGVWTYTGTATNPTDAAVEYRVFVAFLDPAGETLASLQADNAVVEPGASATFTVEFPSDVTDLRCVPRVERRTQ